MVHTDTSIMHIRIHQIVYDLFIRKLYKRKHASDSLSLDNSSQGK